MNEALTLKYNLAELPSSQHRAGLAGLVLMIRWLQNEPDKKGVCEITELDRTSATFQVDQEGLQFLFDKVYAAQLIEEPINKPWEKKLSKKDLKQESISINMTSSIPDFFETSPNLIPFGKLLFDGRKEVCELWEEIWKKVISKTLRGKYLKDVDFQEKVKKKLTDWNDLDQVCEIDFIDENNAVLRINRSSLQELYSNAEEDFEEESESEVEEPTNEKFLKIPRVIRFISASENDNEEKLKVEYIYGKSVPKGAYLEGYDRSEDKIWIKLWRDMIWSILRGVPATRGPYEERSEGSYTKDAEEVWEELNKESDHSIELPSTYFIGAQASNAEDVPFRDLARFQFLLHFWAFVAQIYVPTELKYDRKTKTEKSEYVGYALVIPDVASLETFCDEYPDVLQSRGDKLAGYRPKESVIDIAAEGGLDLMKKLDQRLEVRTHGQVSDLLLGVDVVHLEKKGNNIRLWGNTRIDPIRPMIDEYARVKDRFTDKIFRRQRMLNVLNEKDWFFGYDSLLSKTESEQTIGNRFFRSDVRKAFEDVGISNNSTGANFMDTQTQEKITKKLEEVIYKLVRTYIREKLRNKYGLEWSKLNSEAEKNEYNEKKGKVAREAFLAIRSRTDEDFIEYFASSICSYHQFSLKGDGFDLVARALYDEEKRNQVRTLTMLALSANGYSPKSEKKGDNQ